MRLSLHINHQSSILHHNCLLPKLSPMVALFQCFCYLQDFDHFSISKYRSERLGRSHHMQWCRVMSCRQKVETHARGAVPDKESWSCNVCPSPFPAMYLQGIVTVCTPRTDQHIVIVIAVYVSTFCLYSDAMRSLKPSPNWLKQWKYTHLWWQWCL